MEIIFFTDVGCAAVHWKTDDVPTALYDNTAMTRNLLLLVSVLVFLTSNPT